jgi:hypothetical protein
VPVLHWDASALTKRYHAEVGSDVVDELFDAVPSSDMITTFWGYAETYASLLRKRNRGDISAGFFAAAVSLLQTEILDSPDWVFLTVEDSAVLDGIQLVLQHNLTRNMHQCPARNQSGSDSGTWCRVGRWRGGGDPVMVGVASDCSVSSLSAWCPRISHLDRGTSPFPAAPLRTGREVLPHPALHPTFAAPR